ncbi:AAA family ATPase, partial [Glaciimonas sp. CA11.2]|uniref:AAA family ATPase n=1 Tax=Glaciimonas sp. CA11.2 TaxID=3048601 RepID=UPI002B22DEC2
ERSRCARMVGHDRPESVVTIGQNTHLSFRPGHNAFRQNAAAEWVGRFSKKVSSMTTEEMEAMVAASYLHWTNVVQATGKVSKKIKRQASVQVFDPNSLERTAFRFNELKDDRRAAGARILQSAQKNNGERSLPNCKAAYSKLEAAKSNFENLVEPIQRLQIDLTLSAAMKPNKFRLSPILLLGEPGIGKTYLATQLAKALGVCTEKISAGGSQGGFQMTGSHTGWAGARPGMIFTLLAEGDSAAPVLVIDEVEKIKDATYPVLPVLLDLLDAGSGT